MYTALVSPDKITKKSANFLFYLPGGYPKAANKDNQYNILTKEQFMHQISGDASLIKSCANKYNCFILYVCGDSLGFYRDWVDTSTNNNYETYHNKELYPTVFNTLPWPCEINDIGIFGVSMGGYGVLRYYIDYPELYSFLGTMSGLVSTKIFPNLIKLIAKMSPFLPNDKKGYSQKIKIITNIINQIFGNVDNVFSTNPVDEFLKMEHVPKFMFQSIGSGFETNITPASDPSTLKGEKLLRPQNMFLYKNALLKQKKNKHFNYCFVDRSGGHTTNMWNNCISTFFDTLTYLKM
jgi:S-formylglutathione hydrolase FrmB